MDCYLFGSALKDNFSIFCEIIFFCKEGFKRFSKFSIAFEKAELPSFWQTSFIDFSSSILIVERLTDFNLFISSSIASNKVLEVWEASIIPCWRIWSAFDLAVS